MHPSPCVLLLGLLAPLLAAAQVPPPAPVPVGTWNVRIEMLVVDVPEAQALAWLPDLRDEAKIEEGYARIMAAIAHQEATLVAYPIVQTTSGNKATSETINEFLYPTQFEPPDMHGTLRTPGVAAINESAVPNLAANPTQFEKRNLGTTLEVEAVVRPGGKWIDLNIQPQRVVFQGYEWFEALKTPSASSAVQQPRFFTTKVSTSYAVRNGQRILSGFHKLNAPEHRVELDLLQVVATWTDNGPR